MDYLYLAIGVLLLLYGGDWLVKASIDIALRAKISLLVVGMTVVSFATSAPELLVSIKAGMEGYQDIAFGNVVGSNIANIALILGLTAMIYPMTVARKTIRLDYWVMVGVTALLWVLIANGLLSFWESLLLFLVLVAYNVLQIRASRRAPDTDETADAQKLKPFWLFFYLAGGIAGLRFGADFLIEGAVNIAQEWGVSERVIGLTVVSVGTSLPELAASLVASFKGKQDLSLGNLIGSNVFNILAVLGITGLIIDLPVKSPALMTFDLPALFLIMAVLYLFIRFKGRARISRAQGIVLFLLYTLYLIGVFIAKA